MNGHERILRYFEFGHLPEPLQAISAPFCDLADKVARESRDHTEADVALRKLLEAKDAAVRAALPPASGD